MFIGLARGRSRGPGSGLVDSSRDLRAVILRAVYLRVAHTTTATAIILTQSVSEATQQVFSLTLRASPWWIAKIGGAGFLTRWFNPLNRPGGLGNPPHTINDAERQPEFTRVTEH